MASHVSIKILETMPVASPPSPNNGLNFFYFQTIGRLTVNAQAHRAEEEATQKLRPD